MLPYFISCAVPSGVQTPHRMDHNDSTYCTMERMANLYLNYRIECASDSSSPEGTLFLRSCPGHQSPPEITSGYSSDNADTPGPGVVLFEVMNTESLIPDMNVVEEKVEEQEVEPVTGSGIGTGMGIGIAGGGGAECVSEKLSPTSPLFLSLMMSKMVNPFSVNTQNRRGSRISPFFPVASSMVAQPSINPSRRGSFAMPLSSARSTSSKQSAPSLSHADVPASAARLLEMEIKRNLRRRSTIKRPPNSSEEKQRFFPNKNTARTYCDVFKISVNDVHLDTDSVYGTKEVPYVTI